MIPARRVALLAAVLAVAGVLCLALRPVAPIAARAQNQDGDDEFSAHGFDTLRIEEEDKLWVPLEIEEQVWEFLNARFIADKDFLRTLDPDFVTRNSTEAFRDEYFDTPQLELYGQQSGCRHRSRFNLTNDADRKSGRELMQLKLNHVDAKNPLMRGELKYEIRYPTQIETPEDSHPMLGIVKPSQRDAIKQRLAEVGVDATSVRPVVTVNDTRRRIYFDKKGQTTFSITLDHVTSRVWWASTTFCEIEPELNEIAFTEADAPTRARMEAMLTQVVGEICTKFPVIHRNLTPKYNKTFDAIEAKLPFLRFLVRHDLTSSGVMVGSAAGLVVVCVAAFLFARDKLRARRARTEHAARLALQRT